MAEINPNEPQGGEEKQFTQADLDRIINKRLSEERAKYPSKEELDAYQAYKESQRTDAERFEALNAEVAKTKKDYETASAEVTRLKHEHYLLSKGVPADDVEYYDYKISKLDGAKEDYEKVAEVYLKEKLKPTNVRMDTGAGFGGVGVKANTTSVMNDLIRGVKH